jgi:riboflavin synthase
MFTGIIIDIGEVVARDGGRFTIACRYPAESIAIGASIACAGCCLTVTDIRTHNDGRTAFGVDVSNETLAVTTLNRWQPGTRINLERSLKLGDELGGHMVSGHVDGLAHILAVKPDGESVRFSFEVPANLARFVAPKGSVALDGTSLTVNEVSANTFGVNLIPHTLAVTTWGAAKPGDAVNFEVDLMARYVARLAQPDLTS